ncbi:MAG: helix-turn-helix domain-containing protein [Thermodesulfobacteriota bacterium]
MKTAEAKVKKLLTITEAAEFIGMSQWFVRELIAKGLLVAHDMRAGTGKRAVWRISRDELERYMESTKAQVQPVVLPQVQPAHRFPTIDEMVARARSWPDKRRKSKKREQKKVG